MQVSELTNERLRHLAEVRPPHGKVLSLFLNLDPSWFGTPQARATEIRSLLDAADRRVRSESNGLSHEDLMALRRDVERTREYFEGDFSAEGAHGLAVFSCSPIDLFETIRLARPVSTDVVIADSPYVEPLAALGVAARWCVALINRAHARILIGTAESMAEVDRIKDDVHGWHDQGGWSQSRYQRGIEHEVAEHVKRAADVLFRRYQSQPFDRLVIGTPDELWPVVEHSLHSYLRERIAGRIHVDIDNAQVDEIHRVATPVFEADERRHEREALDRLNEGLSTGHKAAAGLENVLEALTERRVETLLVADGFKTPGTRCPKCGWLGPSGRRECPADGTALRDCEDVVDEAIQAALAQSAEVLLVRDNPDLGPLGSIGAILRF
jgi:peptide subunit release factor 1 (eRF1)